MYKQELKAFVSLLSALLDVINSEAQNRVVLDYKDIHAVILNEVGDIHVDITIDIEGMPF